MNRRSFILTIPALGSMPGWAASPQRIVSVSPVVTEILYGIGAFGRVVAVTEYCLYPPEAKALPKVGGWSTPSIEKVASFRPDLVVLSDAQKPFLEDPLERLGIATAIVSTQVIADAFNAIQTLGKATGTEHTAGELITRTKRALDAVQRRAAMLPHPTVLCIVDRTPGTLRDLYAAMRGTFLAELIEIAGGKLISGAATGYGRISKERVLTANPDFIIELMPSSKGNLQQDPRLAWHELPELNAVRNDKIAIVREEFAAHDSQMIARTAALFAHLLHPSVPQREWEPR